MVFLVLHYRTEHLGTESRLGRHILVSCPVGAHLIYTHMVLCPWIHGTLPLLLISPLRWSFVEHERSLSGTIAGPTRGRPVEALFV